MDIDFFNVEPEKIWQPPKSYTAEKIEKERNILTTSGLYVVSTKVDGHYYRYVRQNGRRAFLTRGISKVTGQYGDKTEHFIHIVEQLDKICPKKDLFIIGEIYIPGRRDKDITRIDGSKVDRAHRLIALADVRFYIFDVLAYSDVYYFDKPFATRMTLIDSIKYEARRLGLPNVDFAEYFEGIKGFNLLDEVLANGGEGVVFRHKSSVYAAGKRKAHESVKIKREISFATEKNEIDCFIVGYEAANEEYVGKEIENWPYWKDKQNKVYYGNFYKKSGYRPITRYAYNNWIGALKVALYDENGKKKLLCKVSNLPDSLRAAISKNQESFLRRVVTITGMEITSDGSIRHPVLLSLRGEDDIQHTDCTWAKLFVKATK